MGDCACYNTRKAARLLAQAYDRALEPSGLKNTQFSALAAISGSGSDLTITELATKMDVDRTTLTRNLEVLSREGLVRIDAGADARSKRVSLTAAGRERLEAAIPLWEKIQASITARLNDWELLRRDIEKLADAARASR
jgi:DNA-binding MarR family transcriptional regulator